MDKKRERRGGGNSLSNWVLDSLWPRYQPEADPSRVPEPPRRMKKQRYELGFDEIEVDGDISEFGGKMMTVSENWSSFGSWTQQLSSLEKQKEEALFCWESSSWGFLLSWWCKAPFFFPVYCVMIKKSSTSLRDRCWR